MQKWWENSLFYLQLIKVPFPGFAYNKQEYMQE